MRQIFIILVLAFIAESTKSQSVGLVLSGGGSRGFAHIGVIKALEDNNIPIDYITGTSMGAIVGGLYAAGYSPDDMIMMAISGEFQKWASGRIDEKNIFYFKQSFPDASWVTIKFDYDSILQTRLPTSFRSPLELDFAIMKLFAQSTVLTKESFDSLFVPFRCVGADIEAGRPIVFDKGSLGKAIRASMTFPFFFRPIKIEDKLIFDGGIYNNFPADVMENEFSPDFIIGSAVVQNYDPPREDNIMSHIENMITSKTDYDLCNTKGILIRPNVKNISIMDFSNPIEVIDSGYQTALRYIDSLKIIIARRVSSEELLNRRNQFKSNLPPLLFKDVNLFNVKKSQKKYISQILKERDDTISYERLRRKYLRLISDEMFEYFFPDVSYNEESGLFALNLDVRIDKKLHGSFGGNMSSSVNSTAFIGFQYKHLRSFGLKVNANTYFGKFYSSLLLSGRLDMPSVLPFYLQGDIVYNRKDYFKSTGAFFQNIRPSYLIMNEQYYNISTGFPLGNNTKLEMGFVQANLNDKYYLIENFKPTDTADVTTFHCVSPQMRIEANTLNRKQYADKGYRITFDARFIRGNERNYPGSTTYAEEPMYKFFREWFYGKFSYEEYFRPKKRLKPSFLFETVYSSQRFFNNYPSSILRTPSFQPMPESKTLVLENFRANVYAAIGGRAVYSIMNALDFRAEAYLFQPYMSTVKEPDNTAAFGLPLSSRYFMAGSALVYHTMIGPVSLSFNYYHRYYKNYSLMFNFGYIIFNKGALEY